MLYQILHLNPKLQPPESVCLIKVADKWHSKMSLIKVLCPITLYNFVREFDNWLSNTIWIVLKWKKSLSQDILLPCVPQKWAKSFPNIKGHLSYPFRLIPIYILVYQWLKFLPVCRKNFSFELLTILSKNDKK